MLLSVHFVNLLEYIVDEFFQITVHLVDAPPLVLITFEGEVDLANHSTVGFVHDFLALVEDVYLDFFSQHGVL